MSTINILVQRKKFHSKQNVMAMCKPKAHGTKLPVLVYSWNNHVSFQGERQLTVRQTIWHLSSNLHIVEMAQSELVFSTRWRASMLNKHFISAL
jgi:hypothetical protein